MGWSNLFSWIMRWIATTFADFAAAWSAASNSKPGTQVVYEGYLRLHLLPRLGAVEMGKLAPQTIEAFKVACHEHGLSARTIGHILALLRQMLNRAVDWVYLRVNPALRVKAPVVEKLEMQLWTEEEAHRFLEHVPPRGMPSSAWPWPRGCASVSSSPRSGAPGRPHLLRRTDPQQQDPALRSAQDQGQSRQRRRSRGAGESRRAAAQIRGVGRSRPDLPRAGREADESQLAPESAPQDIRDAGVPQIRFHDLRHTFVSLLIQQGENIKVVARKVRHASVVVTLDTYAHLYPEDTVEASRKLERRLFG